MTAGTIFSIKRFAVHDGPGIRTTVFLKGCPLRCLSCHNPEGQSPDFEVFLRPERGTLCPGCRAEVFDAARNDDGRWEDLPALVGSLCPACAEALLAGAVERVGRRVDAEELLEELARDRVYFERSGGGITFSGGEPLAQPDFLLELLDGCRERGIHACLDTCGSAPSEVVSRVAERVDHILYDIKAVSRELHLRMTGTYPERIQENLRFLSEKGVSLVVRFPLLAGWNDHVEEIEKMAAFLSSLTEVPPIDILPYHRIGRDKYERLGREHPLPEMTAPSSGTVERTAGLLAERGLNVHVKGEAYVLE